MNRLIINADDYGLCPSVNEGILDCYSNGLVSDFSFMINPDHLKQSLTYLKSSRINAVGLHINLSLGKSLFSKNNSIADASGNFFSAETLFKKYITAQLKSEDVYQELKSQYDLLLSEGLEISHFDSHHNIHIIPLIHAQINRLMEEYKIHCSVRYPFEWVRNPFSHKFSNIRRIMILNSLSLLSYPCNKNVTKIHTIGGDFFNNVDPSSVFTRVMNQINTYKNSLFEMAVHPGYFSDDISKYDSYSRERETELKFLRSFAKSELTNNTQIISFAEMQALLSLNRIFKDGSIRDKKVEAD